MSTELYKYLMEYAHDNSSETIQYCTCEGGCSHPSGKCPSGNAKCYQQGNCCFNEIYYPEGRENARLKYNCKKLVNQYVFRSLDRYASEIYYALEEYSSVLNYFENYNLLSIGCGPATDLVGVDYYNKINRINKSINYFGIDIEKTWKEIHKNIEKFLLKENNINKFEICYCDAINFFRDNFIYATNINIIILNYLISSFIADNNAAKINELFYYITNFISKNKIKNCLIVINDVNYHLRGKNSFKNILQILNDNSISIFSFKQKYFSGSTFGEKYSHSRTVFGHPVFSSNFCTSAQLLINCGVQNDN